MPRGHAHTKLPLGHAHAKLPPGHAHNAASYHRDPASLCVHGEEVGADPATDLPVAASPCRRHLVFHFLGVSQSLGGLMCVTYIVLALSTTLTAPNDVP